MILQSNLLLTELSIKYIESRMQNLPFFSSTFPLKCMNTVRENSFTVISGAKMLKARYDPVLLKVRTLKLYICPSESFVLLLQDTDVDPSTTPATTKY